VAEALAAEKRQQAVAIMARHGLAGWLSLVRETGAGGAPADPVLALWAPLPVVGVSAFLLAADGRAVAVVAGYDREAAVRSGLFDEVRAYDDDWRPALRAALDGLATGPIGVNYSPEDHAADGISHGLYLALVAALGGTGHAERLVSAEAAAAALRGCKTAGELARLRRACALAETVLADLGPRLRPGVSEGGIHAFVHERLRDLGAGPAWEAAICPTVHVGPLSAQGHVGPGAVRAQPGDLVHVDFGVVADGYCSDLQRVWYVPPTGRDHPPEEVLLAFEAVRGAIAAAQASLRPGVAGYEVDAVAREHLREAGYPEFRHALGHQVGRACHDGGGLLGPLWPRYAARARQPVAAGQVWTLEVEVATPYGVLGLEEMVTVGEAGAAWLSHPQTAIWLAG
jgi:Xaa-Pro aminopeptidase